MSTSNDHNPVELSNQDIQLCIADRQLGSGVSFGDSFVGSSSALFTLTYFSQKKLDGILWPFFAVFDVLTTCMDLI
jgi:hypothetical protein